MPTPEVTLFLTTIVFTTPEMASEPPAAEAPMEIWTIVSFAVAATVMPRRRSVRFGFVSAPLPPPCATRRASLPTVALTLLPRTAVEIVAPTPMPEPETVRPPATSMSLEDRSATTAMEPSAVICAALPSATEMSLLPTTTGIVPEMAEPEPEPEPASVTATLKSRP